MLAPGPAGGRSRLPSVVGVAGLSLLTPHPGGLALRLAVIGALLGLGLAGLAQLPLEPPLSRPSASQPGAPATAPSAAAAPVPAPLSTTVSGAPGPLAGDADLLATLDRQEALQDGRQRATVLLRRFVGAEITRFFWGGFSGTLDVLGLEPPEDMAVRLTLPVDVAGAAVQLELTPQQGRERYLARVVAAGSVPHGVACRGWGPVGSFVLQGGQLLCPPGWQELPFRQARR